MWYHCGSLWLKDAPLGKNIFHFENMFNKSSEIVVVNYVFSWNVIQNIKLFIVAFKIVFQVVL